MPKEFQINDLLSFQCSPHYTLDQNPITSIASYKSQLSDKMHIIYEQAIIGCMFAFAGWEL